ncbi:MAG: hypothetical protein ABIN48_14770 [Ginsengibacter sp.]
MKIIKIIAFFSLVILISSSCKKNLLDVENLNDPDFSKAISNGEDVENVASGLFNTIYKGEHSVSGLAPVLAVSADNVSCSWGNFGMRDMSYEPRNNGWNNSPSYSNKNLTKYLFDRMYSAIGTASSLLKAMETGIQVGEGGSGNQRVKAFSKFAQGVGYGNLALVFDRAFLVDEKVTVEEKLESAVPYNEVAIGALKYLDEAIALSSGTFTIPKEWLGTSTDYSSSEFKKLCNTMAARIMAYTPRNRTELAAVNWPKVKAYADAGITKDFTIIQDGAVKWYDEASDYLLSDGWGITDMYVVNMMDPVTQPQHWTDNASFPYPPKSTNPIDKRLNTDYEYVPSNWFQAARGYYHFSSYRNARYDEMYVTAKGPKPQIMLSENDMLRAEARAYTNDLAGAAAIINAGTRKTRGAMPDVAPVLADIVKAMHHERHVEMYTAGMGLQFFEMRKLNLLQKGTPLHFPLAAGTLETFGIPLPFYTFGYIANADGKGTSNGGWR